MKVFVTVGTTKFDSLIEAIFSDQVQKSLKNKKYKNLKVQIGNSKEPNLDETQLEIDEIYKFKPSLIEDIEDSDLVIAHAGAGTCLEVLGAKKPLIVVINEDLMGNHQIELAERLGKNNHLIYCVCSELSQTISNFNAENLVPYPKGDISILTKFIDNLTTK